MRKSIYQMVHVYDGNALSVAYKWFMILSTLVSFVPLVTKETNSIMVAVDCTCLTIYLVDFVLRWLTADYKLGETGWKVFVKFPFRWISIVDLIAIFGLVCPLLNGFAQLKTVKALTVFRFVRIFRYSKNMQDIAAILRKSKKSLIAVGSLAVGYIFGSALIIYNVEPDTFNTFFDAIYWATVSLTTVGYGDLYPVSTIGRVIAMISSFFGIAIVALPAGVISAEYLNRLKNKDDD